VGGPDPLPTNLRGVRGGVGSQPPRAHHWVVKGVVKKQGSAFYRQTLIGGKPQHPPGGGGGVPSRKHGVETWWVSWGVTNEDICGMSEPASEVGQNGFRKGGGK